MADVVEIRWHGRGGQGVVTASELLAEAALVEGKYFQALPEFGAERSGAPLRAYTRLSSSPIHLHCSVTNPDIVVVLDPTLLGVVKVTEGLKPDGTLVANTTLSPQQLRERLGLHTGRVYTVDATRIALDAYGRNIPNTPMLGALLRASPVVELAGVVQTVQSRLGSRVAAKVVEGNVQALKRAFAETQAG
ncbi:MAG: 2-oxoacid:acceptor oxidoreductase family protein [Chloroflexi bacterium]|nr:2-oxoacid:acceptor oxidoreductase family protein [Chloroflexota bacterium]